MWKRLYAEKQMCLYVGLILIMVVRQGFTER